MNDFLDNHAGKLMIGITIIGIIIIFSATYYSACRSAEIFNIRNRTNYSCSDFFWASKQINSQTQTLNLINK